MALHFGIRVGRSTINLACGQPIVNSLGRHRQWTERPETFDAAGRRHCKACLSTIQASRPLEIEPCRIVFRVPRR